MVHMKKALSLFFGVYLLAWLIAEEGSSLVSEMGTGGWLGLAVLLIVAGYIYLKIATSRQRERAIVRAKDKMHEITKRHLDTLARKRLMLVKADEYGDIDTKPWNAEVQRFVDRVYRPTLTEFQAESIAPTLSKISTDIIEKAAREEADRIASQIDYDGSMSPLEYEHYCSRLLNGAGWNTSVTQASGDQGADIIATKDTKRVVIQCKQYGTPVGNFAVQEIAAARSHYKANVAVVVSTAGYTSSAKQLAATNDVHLLHHSDLLKFQELLDAARV